MKPVHEKIYELLKNSEKGHVLDAACGKGAIGSALENRGFKVFYADRYDRPEDAKLFVNTDLNRFLPFKGKSFGIVVCSESLQYIENHNQIIGEFGRVLKEGGRLVVSFPNILSVSSRLFFLRRGYFPHFKPYKAGDSYKRWNFIAYNPVSFVEVFQIMKRNGFEVRTVTGSGMKTKGIWLYFVLKALYSIGLLFEKDKERAEMIKKLSSRELLLGDHVIVCGVKAG